MNADTSPNITLRSGISTNMTYHEEFVIYRDWTILFHT